MERGEWFCQQGPGPRTLHCAALLNSVPWATCAKWPSSQLARRRLAAQLRGRHVPRHSGLRALDRNLMKATRRWAPDHAEPLRDSSPWSCRAGECYLLGMSQEEPADSKCVSNILTFDTERFWNVAVFRRQVWGDRSVLLLPFCPPVQLFKA